MLKVFSPVCWMGETSGDEGETSRDDGETSGDEGETSAETALGTPAQSLERGGVSGSYAVRTAAKSCQGSCIKNRGIWPARALVERTQHM